MGITKLADLIKPNHISAIGKTKELQNLVVDPLKVSEMGSISYKEFACF